MRSSRRVAEKSLSSLVMLALLVAACGPGPTHSPASLPSPSALPIADLLALEACDVTGYVPCEHQAALLTEPVSGTGVDLTYSSEWATGRKDRSGWDASAVGLGGWSLDILQRYASTAGVLLSGDGSCSLSTNCVEAFFQANIASSGVSCPAIAPR